MKNIKYLLLLPLFCMLLSCESDDEAKYADPNTDKTTVDYLKDNRFQMFSMILELYERAGYLDLLNQQGTTVIMPSNYSVEHYMAQKEFILQTETGNETLKYTFDDMVRDLPLYKDSLLMYIVEQRINRVDLEKATGEAMMVTSKLGTEMQIYLKLTKLYTEHVPNSVNKYLYYKFVINGLDDPDVDISFIPLPDRDVTNYCQTSGIITQTGILHVLRDEHPLFFNKMAYK